MLVLPADHIIQDQNEFELKVNHALELNNCDPSYLVTFGIQPQSPDTGFSYIES
jgi:mannose-1-phosphate guanylyltransferase